MASGARNMVYDDEVELEDGVWYGMMYDGRLDNDVYLHPWLSK